LNNLNRARQIKANVVRARSIRPNVARARGTLTAFKMHDRNVHDVQYGVARVSLFRVTLLWHLEISMVHIDPRA
jgi:hypothetical protein